MVRAAWLFLAFFLGGWAEHPAQLGGLRGTLLLPAGEDSAPAVLILAGSGPTDRDGNQPGARNDALRLLAEGLAEAGIASLRVDKRGVGQSLPAWPEAALRFDTYVEDAAAWMAWLAAQPRLRPPGVVGHSEGALVATLLARREPGMARLVLLAGAGEPAGLVIARQLAAAPMPAELRAEALRAMDMIQAGESVTDVPPALAPLLRPSVQPYLRSWLPLDPAAALAGVAARVLLVQGTHDLQLGEADARLLLAARPDAMLFLVPGMNHILRIAPAQRAENLATYNHPGLPLAPGLVERIAAFLRD